MYKQSFIDKVIKIYGETSMAAEHARNGSQFLGRILDDSRDNGVSIEAVLNEPYDKVIEKAKHEKEKNDLYGEWLSGEAYEDDTKEEAMCPIMMLQNSDYDKKEDAEKVLCKGVKYFSSFYGCQNWSCRKECWKRYREYLANKE